jgi:ubiquinone/menaquinone biosynthesis C-methylase UbiE
MDKAHDTSRWDKAAANMKHWMSNDGYLTQFTEKVRLKPEWTVLDVGCGPGGVALWAAKRAKHVTALDYSGKMLELVKESVRTEGIENITCLQRSWDDGNDDGLVMHDVVIASRTIGTMKNPAIAIERINRFAGKCAYVTCGMQVMTPLKQQIDQVTAKEPKKIPSGTVICDELKKLGIKPEIEYINGRSTFTNLDDALEHFRWADGALTAPQETRLRQLLDENLVRHSDGSREYPYDDLRWAIIQWQKK